jgi:hypothetical protein
MNKARRLLTRGWLGSAISNFTSGWFISSVVNIATSIWHRVGIAQDNRSVGIEDDDSRKVGIAKDSRRAFIEGDKI